MATYWEGENLLVKLSGILRFCCEPTTSRPPSTTSTYFHPILPQGYRRGHVVEEPQVITDPNPWWQLLANHRQDAHRFTILPTISVVPPWGDDGINETSNFIEDDQVFGESYQQVRYLSPTPVLPHHHHNALPSDSNAGDVMNSTQRFYNALRVVLHGGTPPESVQSFREDSRDSVNADIAGVAPHVFDSLEPHVTAAQDQIASPAMSPLLQIGSKMKGQMKVLPKMAQVCAVLGIIVVLMVILFHWHHFRQDCMTERRALRRVAKRYHVARVQDDVEKSEEVTDVTL